MLTLGKTLQKLEKKNILSKLFFIFITLYSCKDIDNNNRYNSIEVQPILSRDTLNILIDNALNKNDTMAYNFAASYCILNNMGEEFFFTAFAMANKHNNAEACYHVYDILAYSTPKEPKEALRLMDSKTRNLALFYLMKSYEMGFESAQNQVYEIFEKGKPLPKSAYFLQEFSRE